MDSSAGRADPMAHRRIVAGYNPAVLNDFPISGPRCRRCCGKRRCHRRSPREPAAGAFEAKILSSFLRSCNCLIDRSTITSVSWSGQKPRLRQYGAIRKNPKTTSTIEPAAKVDRRKAPKKKQIILDAAEAVFVQRGFYGAFRSSDLDKLLPKLVSFFTAGFQSVIRAGRLANRAPPGRDSSNRRFGVRCRAWDVPAPPATTPTASPIG